MRTVLVNLSLFSLFLCLSPLSWASSVDKPLRLGVIHFDKRLDHEKTLAEADYAGWEVIGGDHVLGSVNENWVSFIKLDTLEFKWWLPARSSLAVPAVHFHTGDAYLGFISGELLKVSLNDGKVVWRTELSSYPSRALTKVGNLLIAQTTDGNVYAVRLSDGKVEWVTDIGAVTEMVMRVGSPPTALQNQVLLANADGALFALDAKTGRVDWREYPQDKKSRFVGYVGTFHDYRDRLIGVRYDGHLRAFRPNQGQVWSKNVGSEVLTSLSLENEIWLGTSSAVMVVEPASGNIVKTIPVSHPVSYIVALPQGYLLASESGELTALDKQHRLMWRDHLAADIKSKPFVIGKRLFVSSGLKNIYVYQVR